MSIRDSVPASWLLRQDNPVALAVARKLFAMSAIHNVGLGTNPFWGRKTDTEHGELGVLQVFTDRTLVGGGRVGSRASGVEPNAAGLSDVALQLDSSAGLVGGGF